MNDSALYDEGLEEIWRIKREIAAEYPTLDEYFKGMEEYRHERMREGVKLVHFPSDRLSGQAFETSLSVAEAGAEYDPPPSAPSPAP